MKPSSSKTADDRRRIFARSAAESPILRGAFVHRMGESAEDERLAAQFWTARGLAAEGMEDPNERFSRRPDLLLSRDRAPWACCEVKTVRPHEWRVHLLREDGEETRTEKDRRSVYERLRGDLITAERQLRAENPDHSLLNIVLLVNRDSEASLDRLSQLLVVPPTNASAGRRPMRDSRQVEELRRFRANVDLCLWTAPREPGELGVEGCILFNPGLQSFAEGLTGLRGARLISLAPAA